MARKLTLKQRKFVDNYIETGNATQSALEAGYSKRTARAIGQENLTKLDIKNYINEQVQAVESKKIAKSDEVLKYYTSVLRGEALESVVVTTAYSVHTVEKPPDIKTRMSAGKELMKRYPDANKLIEAQTRKTVAEAKLAEAHLKNAEEGNDDQMNVLGNLLNELKDGVSDGS